MKAGVARRIASKIEMGLSPKVKGNLIVLAKSNCYSKVTSLTAL